jgi:hypothetical protein
MLQLSIVGSVYVREMEEKTRDMIALILEFSSIHQPHPLGTGAIYRRFGDLVVV